MQKLILENIKTNNSGEADKPRVSLARENRPDTFFRKTHFQWCVCWAKARRECLKRGRCLTVFSFISEQGLEYYTELPEWWCQLQGNTKQTHLSYIPSLWDEDIMMGIFYNVHDYVVFKSRLIIGLSLIEVFMIGKMGAGPHGNSLCWCADFTITINLKKYTVHVNN